MKIIIFLLLGGMFKAMKDKVQFHWDHSIFKRLNGTKFEKWFNPKLSHKNKYEWSEFLSKTTFIPYKVWEFLLKYLFVGLTDFWHFVQNFEYLCWFMAFNGFFNAIKFGIIGGIFFLIFFHVVLEEKSNNKEEI
jgi:hypothetical protein